jgi:predicted flap endonuclease-1-like 5' DNA nuclease
MFEVRFLEAPGTRRRHGLEFGKVPVYLERLPPEVAADRRLRVKEVDDLPTGAHLTPLPGQPKAAQQPTSDPKPPGTPKPPSPDDPVTDIKGVGKGTAAKLAEAGIATLGELADLDPEALAAFDLTEAAAIAIRDWLAGPGAALKPERVQ